MKTFTMAIAAVAVVLGLAGGTAAYTLASDPAATTDQVSAESVSMASPSETASPEEPKVRFKPCPAPTHREGKNCVEDVVKTVVLPAPASDQSSHQGRGSDEGNNSDDHNSGPRDKDKANNRHEDSDDDGDDRDHDDDDDSHDDDDDDTGRGDDD